MILTSQSFPAHRFDGIPVFDIDTGKVIGLAAGMDTRIAFLTPFLPVPDRR